MGYANYSSQSDGEDVDAERHYSLPGPGPASEVRVRCGTFPEPSMPSSSSYAHRDFRHISSMAPKRTAAVSSSSKAASKPKLSRLAKENNITNEQEQEINEAFGLFSEHDLEGVEDEKAGVLKTDDVRRCLIALGITVKARDLPEIIDTLDPGEDGYVTYEHFLAYAALYRHHNNEADDANEERKAEVDEAYRLFTNNHTGPINLRDLRRIAKILKEDVSDEVLKNMLVEANGESGEGWRKGVNIEDFAGIMKRAGVFG